GGPGAAGRREQPDPADRPGTGEAGARGRVLHREEALPERRLLLRHHPRGDGLPDIDVHADLRPLAHGGLDLAVEGDDRGRARQGRPSPPAPRRPGATRLRGRRESRLSGPPIAKCKGPAETRGLFSAVIRGFAATW